MPGIIGSTVVDVDRAALLRRQPQPQRGKHGCHLLTQRIGVVPVARHHQDKVIRVADESPIALSVSSAFGSLGAGTQGLRLPRLHHPPPAEARNEQALRLHQAVSGYWHTLSTLAAYCRVRTYLVSTRGHNIRAIDAIHNALTGNPWLPTPATT